MGGHKGKAGKALEKKRSEERKAKKRKKRTRTRRFRRTPCFKGSKKCKRGAKKLEKKARGAAVRVWSDTRATRKGIKRTYVGSQFHNGSKRQ